MFTKLCLAISPSSLNLAIGRHHQLTAAQHNRTPSAPSLATPRHLLAIACRRQAVTNQSDADALDHFHLVGRGNN
jgi:hypothetical protein